MKVPDHALVKKDLDALTHLDIIKSTQENWVIPGTTEANEKPVHHNVSCTVVVKEQEWDSVISYLYFNRNFFSAVSLLPDTGDKIFAQAPNESVATTDDYIRFESLLSNMRTVDYTTMYEYQDETELMQEIACAGGQCEL